MKNIVNNIINNAIDGKINKNEFYCSSPTLNPL